MMIKNNNEIQKIAVLITCHNRKKDTLACLSSIYKQRASINAEATVFLVDDGCSDGTAETVRHSFPDVNILSGNGSLYWCGGMRLAFSEAAKQDFDYYLWLNDDTLLHENAISTLLETKELVDSDENTGGRIIVAGSTNDPLTGKRSYGGSMFLNPNNLAQTRPVLPGASPVRCDVFTGNIVLIPREVFLLIGNLSQEFTHAIGDIDYAHRARKAGVQIWLAPRYIGTCPVNRDNNQCFNPSVPIFDRMKILYSPKGLPPQEWAIFARRHYGYFWLFSWLKLHLRALFPAVWNAARKSKNES